jgi:hypothetical protein
MPEVVGLLMAALILIAIGVTGGFRKDSRLHSQGLPPA